MDFRKEVDLIKDDLIKDIKTLCLIPSTLDESTSGENQPFGKANRDALDQMLAIGKRDGFITDDVDGYAGSIDIGEGEEALGILGHLDVVPVNEKGWHYPPFDCTVDGDYLYGRGVADDKGPLLAAYYAAKIVNNMDFDKKYKVRVIFGCNEEMGSACVNYYFKHRPFPTLAFTPDAEFPVIFGEKAIARFTISGTQLNNELVSFNAGTVVNIVPGEATCKVTKDLDEAFNKYLSDNALQGTAKKEDHLYVYTLKGKSAHASTPDLGVNAITHLVHFLSQNISDNFISFIDGQFYNDTHGEKLLNKNYVGKLGETTCNLAILNYENNHYSFSIDMRLPHELKEEELVSIIKEKTDLFNMNVDYDYTNALYVDPESELIQKLHNSYVEFTNDHDHHPQAIGGGTYAKECPNCVAFGCEFPGRDNAMHQDDEHILIEDLLTSTAIYAKAIYDLIKK